MVNLKIDDYIAHIELEDKYVSDTYGTTTLYFSAPKELLNSEYPEAVSAEISVEFPTDHPEACLAGVEISPTEYDEEGDAYTDYEWLSVDMAYEDIERLMNMAKEDNIHG